MVTNYLKQEQYNFSVLIVGIFHTNHGFMLFLRHANDDYSMCPKGALTTEDRLCTQKLGGIPLQVYCSWDVEGTLLRIIHINMPIVHHKKY